MTKVKICGISNLEDAIKSEALGADFLGFIFFEKSPRTVSVEKAKEIISNLSGSSQKVGLFLDQDIDLVKSQSTFLRLDLIQLHGNEEPSYVAELKRDFKVLKSFKIKKDFDFSILDSYEEADFYLFDAFKENVPGGTGVTFDWSMLKGRSFSKPIFLAGGLRPGNVRTAIETVKPFAVDVASGVELKPGKKDFALLEKFLTAVKQGD